MRRWDVALWVFKKKKMVVVGSFFCKGWCKTYLKTWQLNHLILTTFVLVLKKKFSCYMLHLQSWRNNFQPEGASAVWTVLCYICCWSSSLSEPLSPGFVSNITAVPDVRSINIRNWQNGKVFAVYLQFLYHNFFQGVVVIFITCKFYSKFSEETMQNF